MNDTDELAAETRRLLDAATPGEWGPTIYRGTGLGWDVDGPEAGIRGQFEDEADAELIAAAPRLLANWLARSEQTEAVEDDLGRIANENAALAGRLMAERDRLADENRALREAIGDPEWLTEALETARIEWPAIHRLAEFFAAADRGVTDGDRNEGDEE